jgi:methanogenic corrinoid protein MtbC1
MRKDKRADELASSEDLDVICSALFQALEADLSTKDWPRNSKVIIGTVENDVHTLIALAEDA